ncbi:MAG: putative haloacid dehalogenase-like hydrolase family protein, partial [Jatrophihabitantaceae bacterium]|nr:putative haloacid dehalogenase-like hydrolase family protein [Jatrophihabitantaceae bacterium]
MTDGAGPLAGVTVLLDLDGTLTDSAPGIVASMQYAVDALKLPPLPADARSRFVGPPMHDNLRDLYARAGQTATEAQLDEAVVVYREHYVPIGMFDN